jgi:DNA-binding IclR family transcriptional regulator
MTHDSLKESSRTLQTVTQASEILNTIYELDGACADKLSEQFEMSRSAIYNYLTTLQQNRWLVKRGKKYHLSLRFITLGRHVKIENTLFRVAKSDLMKVAEETEEMAHLATEEHGRRVSLDTKVGKKAVGEEYHQRLEPSHLHDTAGGKAILAYLGEDRVYEIIDRYGLPATTANTITDPDDLFDELSEIRNQGYAVTDQEHLEGLRAIGATIIDRNDEVLGSVAVSGPISRLKGQIFRKTIPEAVMDTARTIELSYNMENRIAEEYPE